MSSKPWLFGALASLAMSPVHALELSSPDLANGATLTQEFVFKGFGCDGQNHSPALTWKDAPAGTRSFAVTLYDPDAPTGSGWWHWLVFNIPAGTQSLPNNAGTADGKALPAGSIQSRTDFGSPGFGGACPPVGDKPHRYQLTLFALDQETLPLDANTTGAMVGYFLNQHALDKAQMTWTFGR